MKVDGKDCTQALSGEQRSNLRDLRKLPAIVCHGQLDAIGAAGSGRRHRFIAVQCQRLFAEDMFAVFGARDD